MAGRERLVVMKGYMREGQPQLPGLEGTMFTRGGSRKLCSLHPKGRQLATYMGRFSYRAMSRNAQR